MDLPTPFQDGLQQGGTRRHERPGPLVALALVLSVALGTWLTALLVGHLNPLRRAWRAAAVAGRYRWVGETRWQAGGERDAWRVVGDGRLDGRLALTLTQAGGVTLAAAPAPAMVLAIAWPDVRLAPPLAQQMAPDPHALARALPGGDPLALLAVGQGARSGTREAVGDRDCRVWDFQVSGASYLAWWRAHPGFLPVNADSGGLPTFQAQGRLWQDPVTQLPCRLSAQLLLPRVAGEVTGQAWLDWRYDWPAEPMTIPIP